MTSGLHPKVRFILNIIIVLSFAVTVFIIVLLLAQGAKIQKSNQDLLQAVNLQTDINQRYLRCILLIERDKFQNPESRVAAIDKCAIESRTPDGQPTGSQPTSQQQEKFESNKASAAEQKQTVPPITNPPQASPPQTNQTSNQSNAQPTQPQSSLLERVTQPVTDILKKL